MKHAIMILASLLLSVIGLKGQRQASPLEGTVSFITSKNVYVKFDRTDQIEIGDTLQLAATDSPCLLVSNKSSSSCVCAAFSWIIAPWLFVLMYTYRVNKKPSIRIFIRNPFIYTILSIINAPYYL